MSLYDYIYNTERIPYYDFEKDFSNPKPLDWNYYPPTFITQVIRPEELHDYILELVEEEEVPIIMEKVDKKIQQNLQWGLL